MREAAFVKNFRRRVPLQISIYNQLYLLGLGFTKYNRKKTPKYVNVLRPKFIIVS